MPRDPGPWLELLLAAAFLALAVGGAAALLGAEPAGRPAAEAAR